MLELRGPDVEDCLECSSEREVSGSLTQRNNKSVPFRAEKSGLNLFLMPSN